MNNDESSIDSGNLGLKKQLDLILSSANKHHGAKPW